MQEVRLARCKMMWRGLGDRCERYGLFSGSELESMVGRVDIGTYQHDERIHQSIHVPSWANHN
jgi:hypothetical protein